MFQNSRYERRKLKREVGARALNHPYMRKMRRNLVEGGKAATEVYRLDGDTPDQHLYFDVYSMRKWTHENMPIVGTWLNWDRADHLITSGAVDPVRISEHTIRDFNFMEPVIIGVNVRGDGNDHILDGAHRYVAMALAATSVGMQGQQTPLRSYFLEREHWEQFLIPRHVAKALRMDDAYDNSPHPWPESGA